MERDLESEHTVTDNDTTHLVFGHSAVHDDAEAQQDPGQVRRLEDKQAQEAEQGVGVLAAPDVDEGAREGGAQKGHAEHGRNA